MTPNAASSRHRCRCVSSRYIGRPDVPCRHLESPAAAERAVEGDDGHQLVALRACEVELGGKELLINVARWDAKWWRFRSGRWNTSGCERRREVSTQI